MPDSAPPDALAESGPIPSDYGPAKLRIALTSDPELPVPPKLYGGIERIIDMLARGLVARGHEVTVFAHHNSSTAGRLISWPGRSSRSPTDTARNAAVLAREALSGRFDLIHSFSRIAYLSPLLPLSIPKIMTYQRAISPRTTRWGLALSRGTLSFTAISDWMMRDVSTVGRWAMVPNGVSLDVYEFAPVVSSDAPLVFLGRVEEIKGQLQREMGLVPIRVLRERRASFVPVHAYDETGSLRYGTAGYLGGGYFITVKHGVLALDDARGDRQIKSVKIVYDGKEIAAAVIDSGHADIEVHPGDWAILKVRAEIDLPPLHVDVKYPYDFADPIFRLGNDYSKGIIVSTGYVGQRMDSGLISCLTDGHPGVSGGGVLDVNGNLVGIPIGRMDGDYRFSFILPLRAEMFRKVPDLSESLRGEILVTD
jgi:hypothetical protein